jgi:lysophospholipase L1-like esterase
MKLHFRALSPLMLVAGCAAFLCAGVKAQGVATPRIEVKEVPVETQAGEGPGKYVPPVPAKAGLPTLWLIGDSTVRNGSKGNNGPDGQWGWGAPLAAYFDLTKINVVNRALGGTSSRSFYSGKLWSDLKPLIKKGDVVMMQFGANDNGDKGALKGTGDDTEVKGDETVHSFGWYLKQFIAETRAQGATPVVFSLTPRNRG